jgi:hypothetical protein
LHDPASEDSALDFPSRRAATPLAKVSVRQAMRRTRLAGAAPGGELVVGARGRLETVELLQLDLEGARSESLQYAERIGLLSAAGRSGGRRHYAESSAERVALIGLYSSPAPTSAPRSRITSSGVSWGCR